FHGAFLVLERMGLGRWMETWRRPFRHLYLLLVVIVSWVFFRAATFPDALHFLRAMVGLSPASGLEHPLGLYLDRQTAVALLAGAARAMALRDAAREMAHRPVG